MRIDARWKRFGPIALVVTTCAIAASLPIAREGPARSAQGNDGSRRAGDANEPNGSVASNSSSSRGDDPIGRVEVRALARIEPETGLVRLGGRPGARVESIAVAIGDRVSKGQVVAILEGNEVAKAELALAEAEKAAALFSRRVKRELLAIERSATDRTNDRRIELLKETIDSQKTNVDQAEERMNQLKNLERNLTRPTGDQDLLLGRARGELNAAKADLAALEAKRDALKQSRPIEDRELSDNAPAIQALDRKIDLARSHYEQTMIRAPLAGIVLERFVEAGETCESGIVTIGDPSAIVAIAEVDQADVGEIRTGAKAKIFLLDHILEGTATRIGSVVARNRATPIDPLARQDRRVVEVELKLRDPKLAAKLLGAQVEVSIAIGGVTPASRSRSSP